MTLNISTPASITRKVILLADKLHAETKGERHDGHVEAMGRPGEPVAIERADHYLAKSNGRGSHLFLNQPLEFGHSRGFCFVTKF
ncbi:MAG: hypothetical protein HYX20_02560 [Candidatus Yanofskybacteria bacterium]|nr:hypothetical protein [Candidatus Yanofskybacteria bacterium]